MPHPCVLCGELAKALAAERQALLDERAENRRLREAVANLQDRLIKPTVQ